MCEERLSLRENEVGDEAAIEDTLATQAGVMGLAGKRLFGTDVRPIIFIARTCSPEELRETLKASWTNAVLIAALLNSVMLGVMLDPPDSMTCGSSLCGAAAIFGGLATFGTTLTCVIVWAAWGQFDLVPMDFSAPYFEENLWTMTLPAVSAILSCVFGMLSFVLTSFEDFGGGIGAVFALGFVVTVAMPLALNVRGMQGARKYTKLAILARNKEMEATFAVKGNAPSTVPNGAARPGIRARTGSVESSPRV